MGYVYGYPNNNLAEGYVKCPLTGRTDVRKYKTGKTKNYNRRLKDEFDETRAEFLPNAKDIMLLKTDADEDGTKAENRIKDILKEFAKKEGVETLSTFAEKNSKKEIVYLTNAQWDKLWNKLKSYKSLKLEKEPLKDDWKPKNIGKEITDELFNNLSNYSENKFILGHNLKSAQQNKIHIRVNNIVESQLPLTDLLKKGKTNLLWKNKNIGEHERDGKLDANYRPHADLEYDLDHNYISIHPPICGD